MVKLLNKEEALLAQRTEEGRLRALRSVTPIAGSSAVALSGKQVVNFASNDYLGLSQHPQLIERSIEFTRRYGAGCGASRLISGNLDCYERIEEQLANLKGSEAALIFPSGYQTNATVLSCLADARSCFYFDRLCHNSILHGILAAKGQWSRFQHNNLQDLQRKIDRHQEQISISKTTTGKVPKDSWIVTETVFSMDGDLACLDDLIDTAAAANCRLYVDEAHATGVFGARGMGLAAGKQSIDIVMGTFGKAAGSFGAYIACSKKMRDYLINFCSGFVYSTGLPPAVLGAISAALDLIPSMEDERKYLHRMSAQLRQGLQELGLDTGESASQIIPVIVGKEENAVCLSRYLADNGFFIPAIRPPTVAPGTARLRISVTAAHSPEQIESLLSALKQWKRVLDTNVK